MSELKSLATLHTKNGEVYLNKDKSLAILTVKNKFDTNIYYISTANTQNSMIDLVDLSLFNKSNHPNVGSKAWEPLKLEFGDATYDHKMISYQDQCIKCRGSKRCYI